MSADEGGRDSRTGDPGQPGQEGQEGSPPGGTGGRGGRGGVGRKGERGRPGRTSWLPLLGYLILVLGIMSGFYFQYELSRDNKTFITCVSKWANETAARTSILTPANLARQDKLDRVIRNFSLAQSTDPKARARLRTKFFKDLAVYIQASDEYVATVMDNPLPTSPKFVCGNGKSNEGP